MTMLETPHTTQTDAAARLRDLVPELVALTLDAKQAHWNVVGPSFLTLHALTEDLAVDARGWTDRVAERAVALGVAVDGRPSAAPYDDRRFAAFVPDHDVVVELDGVLERVAGAARRSLGVLEERDVVGHEIVVDVLEGVEKYRWMLRAHAS